MTLQTDNFDGPNKNFTSAFIEANQASVSDQNLDVDLPIIKIEQDAQEQSQAQIVEHFVLSRALRMDSIEKSP